MTAYGGESGRGSRGDRSTEPCVIGMDCTPAGRAVVVRVRDGAELGNAVHPFPQRCDRRATAHDRCATACELGLAGHGRLAGSGSSEWQFAKALQVLDEDAETYDRRARWIEAVDWIVWQLETSGSVGKVRPVLTVVAEDGSGREDVSLLDDVVRGGARRMLTAALEAEVDAYLAELAGERDGRGRRLVVRNGHAQAREVMTAAGAVEGRAAGQ
jgi:hypothetical protein